MTDLTGDPQFVQELMEKLKDFEQQRTRLKNKVTNTDIDVKGNIHIGDKGAVVGCVGNMKM